jgi:predicted nucleic acid-binding protein
MILFLDACTIIYLLETQSPFHEQVLNRIQQYYDQKIAVSSLSLLECCIKPTRENDLILLNRYEKFFEASDVQIIELRIPVIRTATQLRAKYNLPTPDALQIASAMCLTEEILFVTADKRLQKITEVAFLLLEQSVHFNLRRTPTFLISTQRMHRRFSSKRNRLIII